MAQVPASQPPWNSGRSLVAWVGAARDADGPAGLLAGRGPGGVPDLRSRGFAVAIGTRVYDFAMAMPALSPKVFGGAALGLDVRRAPLRALRPGS